MLEQLTTATKRGKHPIKMNTRLLSLFMVASLSASAFADPQSDDEASKARARALQAEIDAKAGEREAAAAAELAKKVVDGEFKVIQVLHDGLLVTGDYKDPATGYYQVIKPIAFLAMPNTDKVVEGDGFTADIRVSGSHSYTDSDGRARKVRRFELVQITK